MTELTPEELIQRQKNRMTLLLIAGIPFIVILTATWLWFYVVDGDLDLLAITGTQNRGTLVTPAQQLDDLAITRGGDTFKYSEQGRKWTLLIPGGQFCDSDCEKTLYLTRQIHTALGKYLPRVRRYYLNVEGDNGSQLQDLMEKEYPQLETLQANRDAFQALLAAAQLPLAGASDGVFYVVDPRGWIMMFYNRDNGYKDTIRDMKFLLKNTSEE